MVRRDPLVTVVIRSYNSEKYIEDAVRSVLFQTYRGPIRILICHDDGSKTDEALKIIDRMRMSQRVENRFIEVVRHPHMSPFRSLLECGLKNVDEGYIAFLDYDNFYSKTYIEAAIGELKAANAAAGYCRAVFIDTNLRPIQQIYPRPLKVSELILRGNYVDISSIVMNSELGRRLYSIFADKLSHVYFDWIFEDYLIALYLAKSGEKVIPIPSAVYFYRLHESNITTGAKRGEPRYYFNIERDIKTYMAYLRLLGDSIDFTDLLYINYAVAKKLLAIMFSTFLSHLLSR